MRKRLVNGVTDSLTGLFTRDGLERVFGLLSRGKRAGFALLDIDHFKLINDCNGHRRGDEVLAELACFLNAKAEDGYIFRMGGDEFLIMLPGYGKRASQQFAQGLNRALGEKVFAGEPDLRITLSIGIALFPVDGTTMKEILNCADIRLYHAKRNGRNQCCIDAPSHEKRPILEETERLIGREKTFLSLKERLDNALSGNMELMVVSGELGVGKTFLCNKFLEYAGMRGALIRNIALDDTSGELFLIKQIVEGLFPNRREMSGLLRDAHVEYRDELARLIDPQGGENPVEEYRVERGLITLFEVLARRSGSLVLFVDDFEKGGEHAVRLLDSLAHTKSNASVLLLIGFGCDVLPACEGLFARFKTSRTVETVVLKPFSREEHRTLVKTLLGSPQLANTLFAFAYERTEGNPLLTKEVLSVAIEQRIIVREEHGWVLNSRKSRVEISHSIHQLLEQRLRSLNRKERELLRYASVAGKRFESRCLAQMKRMSESTVIRLLRTPITLGVVHDEGSGHFSFRLMFRDAFYERMPATERALLHRKIGQLLSRCTADEHLRRSYFHFKQAGERRLASGVAARLFRSAMARGCFGEAIHYIDFILTKDTTAKSQLQPLLHLAAKCYALNGMHERAIALYRELGASSAPRKNQGLLAIARLYRKLGKPSQALDELLAIHTRSPLLLCNTLHEIAETLLQMGRLEKAEEYARKSLLLSKRWGKKKQEADGYYTIGGIFWYRGEYELAADFLKKAMLIYRGLGREREMALTMNRSGIVKWSCGNLRGAAELIEHAVGVFKQKAGVEEEHRAYTNLGILYEAMGRWKEAHTCYRKSLDMALFLNVVPLVCRNHNNIGTLLLKEGRFDDAFEHLRKAVRMRTKSGDRVDLGSSYHNLGIAYLYQGTYGKAAHFLSRARTVFEREGALGMLISNLNAFFELYTFRKDYGKAKEVRERVAELIDSNGTGLQRAQFYRVLARFHRLQGELDESRSYARRGLELLDASCELYEKGKTLYELGLVLLEDGSRDEAEKVLSRARAAFKQLGAKKALERVEHSMVQRGVGTSQRRRQGEKR
jgi:diguanylate cyclase (GGDEF)-like protein